MFFTKNKLNDIVLISSFVALWLGLQLPTPVQEGLGFFLILTIGLSHGANDLRIFLHSKDGKQIKKPLFIAVYVLVTSLGFLGFYVIPSPFLIIFIVVSGFHFGQEHFEHLPSHRRFWPQLLQWCYGSLILLGLLALNKQESLEIISDLTHKDISKQWIFIPLYISMIGTIICGAITYSKQPVSFFFREGIILFLLFIIFSTTSVVWSFTIYFVFWHSIPSIHHQIKHLYQVVNTKSISRYIKDSILFYIAALFFLAGLYYFLSANATYFASVLVAFLGGITFPHVFVMHQLNKSSDKG
jgi:Brp/Blh family beta-carotene 15,15'-monooxygenase